MTRRSGGSAFFGGSEDGASIFHEPLSTEGRRLPEEASHPVHGRKIIVSRGLVHEVVPEVQVVRVGDRLLLGAPGEPSVEMGRRFEEAVTPQLPAGVRDPVVVGLANDYMGYLTTPEEYQMQHYEGGHTVYGLWTSLLVRDSLVALSHSLAMGQPAPRARPAGRAGRHQPRARSRPAMPRAASPRSRPARWRASTASRSGWTGSPMGVDRPVDEPFLTLERMVRGRWRTSDTDLGLSFIWRETSGDYTARYEIPGSERPGQHRLHIHSAAYDLASRPFKVRRSKGAQASRGVEEAQPAARRRPERRRPTRSARSCGARPSRPAGPRCCASASGG